MERTFVLPRSAQADTGVVLDVRVGPLAPGQRVRVTTANGALIGAISPFGPAARRSGGVYPLPVPRDAIRGNTLAARVTIEDARKPPRAPTATEVPGLELRTLDAPQ